MADDDDVRGAPGPEELFAPTGPRRSSFTPAPNDAESREAAANVFDDDEIAAALSAELARVASGPIPIQRPPAEAPAVVTTPPLSGSPVVPPEQAPDQEAADLPAPVAAPPTIPQGPPDWATPLFSEPAEPAQPVSDPFAPSAPSFVPSNGPFPPPGPSAPTPPPSPFFGVGDSADPAPLVDPAQAPTPAQAADAEALRALYSAAPAPTAPPADAPPPPGYEPPTLAAQSPDVGSPGSPGDLRPRRRALSDDGEGSETLSAIEQLQAQLDERDREAREYAAWESSMLEVGTPEALAAVDEARVERSGVAVAPPEPSTPAEEPVAFVSPPASPADDPIPFLPPPFDEPVADLAPPTEEPVFDLAPPPAEPAFDLAPPMDQSAVAPPDIDAAIAAFPPPVDTPDFSMPFPTDDASEPAPPSEALPFPGFGAPSDEPPVDFAAPADPHELVFDPPPVLIEPPPPDGLADLWREASEDGALPGAPTPAPQQDFTAAAPTEQSAVEPSADQPPAVESPLVPAPATAPAGFEDLLVGSGNPDPQPPSTGWIAADANPTPEPGEERRPFGEGVERDEAVDPSDSIFGAAPAPVSVNTAGVAVAPESAAAPPTPMTRLAQSDDEPLALVAPKISPAERAGLEPTPVEQRVGRSARLFWLWFAANSSIAAVVFGTIIFALGVSLRQAIVATLAGVALSFVPLGLGTLAGKRSGQPTMVISRATFGVVGNILPALLALLSRLFWAAALLWVLGAGTADILVGAKLTDGFTRDELTLVAIAVGFVVAVLIAYFGYALVAIVQLVVSVISGVTILGFIALTWKFVNLTTALATPDGSWILAVTGAVLVFSFVGLAWANSSADVARYQRPGSSGAASMLWATFGVAIPSFLLIAYGALLASSNATLAANIAANPLDSLGRLLPTWYPVPLLAATGLSLLSGIVLAIYSGGFALQAAGLRLRRSLSTLLVGLLVVIISALLATSITDFTQLFRDFSTTVAVPIAAWAGLFGAEIMIRKRRFDSTSLLKRGGVYEDVRWVNLVSLVVITAVGFGFLSATLPALAWEGYLFTALGVPLTGQLATTDLGVLVALVLGLLVPLVAGHGGISRQEKATRVAE